MVLLLTPFVLQAVVMLVDELHFHRKRGLGMWEKFGHPLDSLSVFFCYLFLVCFPPTEMNLKIYIGLCAFSCLFITKDEFVHTEECEASENWLHSVLFVIHPVTFLAAGLIWKEGLNPQFIMLQPFVIFAVMIYQIVYWSFFGKSK